MPSLDQRGSGQVKGSVAFAQVVIKLCNSFPWEKKAEFSEIQKYSTCHFFIYLCDI